MHKCFKVQSVAYAVWCMLLENVMSQELGYIGELYERCAANAISDNQKQQANIYDNWDWAKMRTVQNADKAYFAGGAPTRSLQLARSAAMSCWKSATGTAAPPTAQYEYNYTVGKYTYSEFTDMHIHAVQKYDSKTAFNTDYAMAIICIGSNAEDAACWHMGIPLYMSSSVMTHYNDSLAKNNSVVRPSPVIGINHSMSVSMWSVATSTMINGQAVKMVEVQKAWGPLSYVQALPNNPRKVHGLTVRLAVQPQEQSGECPSNGTVFIPMQGAVEQHGHFVICIGSYDNRMVMANDVNIILFAKLPIKGCSTISAEGNALYVGWGDGGVFDGTIAIVENLGNGTANTVSYYRGDPECASDTSFIQCQYKNPNLNKLTETGLAPLLESVFNLDSCYNDTCMGWKRLVNINRTRAYTIAPVVQGLLAGPASALQDKSHWTIAHGENTPMYAVYYYPNFNNASKSRPCRLSNYADSGTAKAFVAIQRAIQVSLIESYSNDGDIIRQQLSQHLDTLNSKCAVTIYVSTLLLLLASAASVPHVKITAVIFALPFWPKLKLHAVTLLCCYALISSAITVPAVFLARTMNNAYNYSATASYSYYYNNINTVAMRYRTETVHKVTIYGNYSLYKPLLILLILATVAAVFWVLAFGLVVYVQYTNRRKTVTRESALVSCPSFGMRITSNEMLLRQSFKEFGEPCNNPSSSTVTKQRVVN